MIPIGKHMKMPFYNKKLFIKVFKVKKKMDVSLWWINLHGPPSPKMILWA